MAVAFPLVRKYLGLLKIFRRLETAKILSIKRNSSRDGERQRQVLSQTPVIFTLTNKISEKKMGIVSQMHMLYAPAMNKGEGLRKVFLALQGNRSQKEIAEKAGLREPKVSLYANAKQFPRDENRRRLAIGLGCESLEQLDRAINLVELRPELADDPDGLKALIGLFDEGADAEKAAAAALENIEDPKLAGILREMSRYIDEAMKAGNTMVSVGEGLSSLRRNLIFHWSRASSPES